MTWKVHVVVDTHSAAELASGTTTLKTFATGFPGITPTVHDTCRTGEQTAFLKQWCIDNGAIYSRHMGAFKKMEIIYEEILRRSTLPTVIASGDLVFYEDMRNIEVGKDFKGWLEPASDGKKSLAFPNHRVVKESGYNISLLYLKNPTTVQQQILKLNAEWEDQTIWQSVYVVKDGVIYEQPRGLTYEMWKNSSSSFSTDDLNKYELLKGGGHYTKIQKELNDRGETSLAATHMTYINAAIAEDWPTCKGARAAMY